MTTLILTHENADFDAVASQLAAYKLNPKGIPLLSQRLNRNVQNFLTLYWDGLPFHRREDWRKKRVENVIIVDTQVFNRVKGIVQTPAVHVIDHHTPRPQQTGWTYQLEQTGANVTLLIEKLAQEGISITKLEATLLMLGIYADTGSLLYDMTTPRDIEAAAWLLKRGAQLDAVRRFLEVPMSNKQRQLYESLLDHIDWHEAEGQLIAISHAQAPEGLTDEISIVAHRLRESLTPDALIVLVKLHDDVQIVMRSTTDLVDVSIIAKALGGGGHTRAAAALIQNTTLDAGKTRLIHLLEKAVKPQTTVAQMMSHGVRTIPATQSVREALITMQQFGHEGYPVVDDNGRLVGLLTRRQVDRTVGHAMTDLPVKRIMRAGNVVVRPSDSLQQVKQVMLSEKWGQLPVVADDAPDNAPPIGIVTRTDLLNILTTQGKQNEHTLTSLRHQMESTFSDPLWSITLAVSQQADQLDMPLYFVGGLVRDLLLGKAPTDLDMVVEGDAIQLAEQLTAQYGGELTTHGRFGTAKWKLDEGVWQAMKATNYPLDSIDFVTARTEFYTQPSVLPSVESSSIKLDLHRRDFTINTLALRLDGAHLGKLLDFYNGQRDLARRLVRVLHSVSFVDDPTRILRAVRFEQRLGFEIEPRTEELLRDSLSFLERVTGDRVRHEFELAFTESDPALMMGRLADLGILTMLLDGVRWTTQTAVAFRTLPHIEKWDDDHIFAYFALWLLGQTDDIANQLMQRLKVRKQTQHDVVAIRQAWASLHQLPTTAKPSAVSVILDPLNARGLMVLQAMARSLDRSIWVGWLNHYWHEWRMVQTAVTGHHLRTLNVPSGRQYSQILAQILAEKRDGLIQTEAQEHTRLQQLAQPYLR